MVRRALTRLAIRYLQQPVAGYECRTWNDPEALLRHARKGDVLLVEGDQRISRIIQYLTRSSWSHAALYIGDELLQRGGEAAAWARRSFGEDARALIVEALVHGVVASPLRKYVDFNIRLCRPHGLRPEDLRVILDEALGAIGWRYDVKNIVDLCRHLLPFTLRRKPAAERLGSPAPDEVICTSLLGRAFGAVRFPILPTVLREDGSLDVPSSGWTAMPALVQRIFHRGRGRARGLFRMRDPTLLAPRDFDLSPYFEVVKFNAVREGFDYRSIRWADLEAPSSARVRPLPSRRGGAPSGIIPWVPRRAGWRGGE